MPNLYTLSSNNKKLKQNYVKMSLLFPLFSYRLTFCIHLESIFNKNMSRNNCFVLTLLLLYYFLIKFPLTFPWLNQNSLTFPWLSAQILKFLWTKTSLICPGFPVLVGTMILLTHICHRTVFFWKGLERALIWIKGLMNFIFLVSSFMELCQFNHCFKS